MEYVISILTIIYIHIFLIMWVSYVNGKRNKADQPPKLNINFDSGVCRISRNGEVIASYRVNSRNYKIFKYLHEEEDVVSFSELSDIAKIDEEIVYSSLKNLRLCDSFLTVSRKGKWAKLTIDE